MSGSGGRNGYGAPAGFQPPPPPPGYQQPQGAAYAQPGYSQTPSQQISYSTPSYQSQRPSGQGGAYQGSNQPSGGYQAPGPGGQHYSQSSGATHPSSPPPLGAGGYQQAPPQAPASSAYQQGPVPAMPANVNPADAHLWQWFQSVDTDRSGHINAQELQRALAAGNLNFPMAIVGHMIRMHDRDRSGTISFQEFCSLHSFLSTVQSAFAYYDKDKSGTLGLPEVQPALQQSGLNLDQSAFYAVCLAFDPDRKGQFKLDDYIAMCLFLGSARNTFQAFDTQKAGRITLDFSQFVYAASQLR